MTVTGCRDGCAWLLPGPRRLPCRPPVPALPFEVRASPVAPAGPRGGSKAWWPMVNTLFVAELCSRVKGEKP